MSKMIVFLSLVLLFEYAQAVCQLPINFTYFQRVNGTYCKAPNLYLESHYGGSFSQDTAGIARETANEYVRFAIHEVTSWDALIARTAELDQGVAFVGGVHTPSLFWDGRQDVFWHANSLDDTISTEFKSTVDAYIAACLLTENSTSAPSSSNIVNTSAPPSNITNTSAPSNNITTNAILNHTSNGDGCSLDSPNDQLTMSNNITGKMIVFDDDDDTSIPCFVLFYSRGCPHCATVRDYIDGELQSSNVSFEYQTFDVSSSDYARHVLAGYKRFDWDGEEAVPTIFIGTEDDMAVLVGEGTILEQLLPRIQSGPATCYDFAKLSKDPDFELSVSDVQWGVLTAAALVDSINPCAIAVLLILLGGLVMSVVPSVPATYEAKPRMSSVVPMEDPPEDHPENPGDKKEATTGERIAEKPEQEDDAPDVDLEIAAGSGDEAINISGAPSAPPAAATTITSTAITRQQDNTNAEASDSERENRSRRRWAFVSGMTFILAVFIAYYALGFGIFTAVDSTTVSRNILLALGIFIIVLGLWNIKDFLWYDKGLNIEIPQSWRPRLKRLLGAVTSPVGAFAAGFAVCLFELPCTGGPYLFILGLLAEKNTRQEAAFLLLYYNFIFVLPLIIINCLVFWGVSMLEKVGAWKEKYIRLLHLFAGLVLLALGILAVVDSQHPLF